MKPSGYNSKRRIPLGIFILIVGILGMLAVVVVCLFTLRFGSFSFLRYANSQSEYLTPEELLIDSPVPEQTPTPLPVDAEATSEPEAPLESVNPITVAQYSTLQLGDNNPDVIRLQGRLMELGYMDYDETTTLFNLSTENAVKLFQRSSNLPQTGVATNELQELLYADDPQQYRAKMSDDGVDVKSAQQRLFELGYYTDKISGYYGPQTELAVRIFQSKNNMDVNGEITREVYDTLYSENALAFATPTPAPTDTPEPTSTPRVTSKVTDRTNPTAKPTAKPTKNTESGAQDTPSSHDDTPASPTDAPAPEPTKTPKPQAPQGGGDGSYGSGIEGMIACAKAHIGCPYVKAAKGPDSFDCSGFAWYCMSKAGVSVGRAASRTYAANDNWQLIENISDLKRGDLIFWKSDKSDTVSHVGICIGGGAFIHASSTSGMVRQSSISGKYWTENFVCGRRIF